MNNAILSGARLTGANLSGVNMSAATLDGVISGGITGNPVLPPGWALIRGYLIGPGANLSGASLDGADLSRGGFFGPTDLTGANLRDAHLAGANLTTVFLNGADITGADLTGAKWNFTMCPNGVIGNTPCAPAVWLGSASLTVSANNSDGTLTVDVGPDLGGATWRVIIQKLSDSGGWAADSVHNTKGPGDTLKLNLPNGTYRAVVPPQRSYLGSVSQAVVLGK